MKPRTQAEPITALIMRLEMINDVKFYKDNDIDNNREHALKSPRIINY